MKLKVKSILRIGWRLNVINVLENLRKRNIKVIYGI